MSLFLGLDTSNYTTSAALYNSETKEMVQAKQLLPVKSGEMGIRQSDAVFHHVKQMPEVIGRLPFAQNEPITAVAASDRPQQFEGSYMPCFLVSAGLGQQLAAVNCVPCYHFTHQQGHVAAALFGSGRTDLFSQRFIAFHVSGGTTDALLVQPDEESILNCRVVAHSLDLKAGQLVDRVGGMLGLDFPAGPALEQLAAKSARMFRVRPTLRGADCHLSGVENQCRTMFDAGEEPADVAAFCMASVLAAISGMANVLKEQFGDLPMVFAGGVMSNAFLRKQLSAAFNGSFAPPAFSADNAAGIALLGSMRHGNV